MGHRIKIQRVERGATRSFYVISPATLAEAALIEKGEETEWFVVQVLTGCWITNALRKPWIVVTATVSLLHGLSSEIT
jgi:hypothetical protein